MLCSTRVETVAGHEANSLHQCQAVASYLKQGPRQPARDDDCCLADIDLSSAVDTGDMLIVLSNWS